MTERIGLIGVRVAMEQKCTLRLKAWVYKVKAGWAMPTTPLIHPILITLRQIRFNGGRSLTQAFYVVGLCKDWSAVEGVQGEKDGPAEGISASVIGHLGGGGGLN